MAQHFLLSPIAASLPDDSLQHMLSHNEPLAYALFMLYRWGSLIEQICPRCGVVDRHLPRVKHKQWRCTGCRHDFSLKSGSLLDNTKLPYWKVLTALLIWMSQPKGLTAITVKNRCELSYESAYTLLHRFRWAFWQSQQQSQLSGEVEVDCVWVLKGVRKANDRRTPRLIERNTARRERLVTKYVAVGMTRDVAEEKARRKVPITGKGHGSNPKKQAILGFVQRGATGGSRVIGVPVSNESFEVIEPIVRQLVAPGSTIYTDFAAAYAGLAANYKLRQINHDELYSDGNGTHTNYVESVFARWRRMEKGTHHKMTARTLHLFFADCAWRENHRRTPPAERFAEAMKTITGAGICRAYKKYGYDPLKSVAKTHAIRLSSVRRVDAADLKKVSGIAGLLAPALCAKIDELIERVKPQICFAQAAPKKDENPTWDLEPARREASILPTAFASAGSATPGGYWLTWGALPANSGSA